MFPTNHDIKDNTSESPRDSFSYSFPKTLRLCKEREIQRVFSNPDRKLFAYPVMALLGFSETASQPEFLFSVGKKKFKRAVDRNRIRRLMKEAVRLNYGAIPNQSDLKGVSSVIWIYTGNEIPDFDRILKSVQKLFHELVERNR